jgi:hypothetical protein
MVTSIGKNLSLDSGTLRSCQRPRSDATARGRAGLEPVASNRNTIARRAHGLLAPDDHDGADVTILSTSLGRHAFHLHRLTHVREIARDERDRQIRLGRNARQARWTFKTNDCAQRGAVWHYLPGGVGIPIAAVTTIGVVLSQFEMIPTTRRDFSHSEHWP